MGVPGFVAWLYHNHKNTNFIFKHLLKSNMINTTEINTEINTENYDLNFDDKHQIDSIDHLLIDANCLIHPQARQVCLDNPHLIDSNLELLEKKIIKQVIAYIELLIDQTKPTKSIYIAVDGVAPMAKIKHQRLRRFKSVYDRKIFESLAKKHNKVLPKEWNTSAITPGTIFMDKLMKSLLSWIKTKKFDCKVIFSSSYTPGEGEHKLLQYMKNRDFDSDPNTVIYGLDADLLFLSLASEKKNIYLMRETSQMEIDGSQFTEGFSYLSIDILNELIRNEMVSRLPSTKMWCQQSLANDFVFLCYFCGNDFLPNIPSLSIKPHNKKIPNGIETIMEAYAEVLSNAELISNSDSDTKLYTDQTDQYLINISTNAEGNRHIKINKLMFEEILENIAEQETAYYNDFFRFKRFINRSNKTEPFDIDKQNYEENVIERYYDPIRLGDPANNLHDWKRKYYKHYHHIDIDTSNQSDNSLNVVLDEYIRGLVWTTYYYYDKCKDYEWFYDHHHGPFISDLLNYIRRFPNRIEYFENLYGINAIWYENEIKPLQQLMLVLPHESSFLVPSSYRNIMFGYKLKEFFPDRIFDIRIDYLYKGKAWQNIPMIPIIPARKILKLTSKVILKEEAERNRIYKDYVKNI
jgi:5'-3' exoribonuclease 2